MIAGFCRFFPTYKRFPGTRPRVAVQVANEEPKQVAKFEVVVFFAGSSDSTTSEEHQWLVTGMKREQIHSLSPHLLMYGCQWSMEKGEPKKKALT